MADGIVLELSQTFVKGADSSPKQTFSKIVTQSGSKRFAKRLTITSGAEVTVSLSEVAAPGRCRITNLDATNFVKIGFATGAYGIAPKAGETEMFRILSTVTQLFVRADTANVDILLEVFDN